MNLQLKNRIALFTALAAAATIGLVFLFVYGIVYQTSYRHLDQDIRQEKAEVLKSLQWTGDSLLIKHMEEWEEQEHQRIEVNPTFLQLVDAGGRVVFQTSNLRKDVLLFHPEAKTEGFYNGNIKEQRIRQGQFPIQGPERTTIGYLIVGISQEESCLVLYNLRRTLIVSFPVLLLVLFMASSLATQKGIAPVQQLIHAASRISGANLSERLPFPPHKDEIHQLAGTINDLLNRVDQGLQREKQFTADASHEIRTPLAAIRGTLEVLLRKRRAPEQYEEKIERVIREVDKLSDTLDQLLQLARLESRHLQMLVKPVELNGMLQTMIEKMHAQWEEKQIKVELGMPAPVVLNADPSFLQIIIGNILENAIKYGNMGGHIAISWKPQTRELLLRDDGPGIPPEHIPFLFDRFYRVDASRNAAVPGAGIGLSIVKKLADLLRIEIQVESRPEEGTLFCLRFPPESI